MVLLRPRCSFIFDGAIPLSFSDYWVASMNRVRVYTTRVFAMRDSVSSFDCLLGSPCARRLMQTEYLTQNEFLPFMNNQRDVKNATYACTWGACRCAVHRRQC